MNTVLSIGIAAEFNISESAGTTSKKIVGNVNIDHIAILREYSSKIIGGYTIGYGMDVDRNATTMMRSWGAIHNIEILRNVV